MSNIVLHPLDPKTPYRCDAEQPILTSRSLAASYPPSTSISRTAGALESPGASPSSSSPRSPPHRSQHELLTARADAEQLSHDARRCPACLRAGTHTVVTSVEQLAAFVVSGDAVTSPGSPRLEPNSTVLAIALESTPESVAAADDRRPDMLMRPLRWILFVDRSADVDFSSPNQRAQFLTLAGGDPPPPLRRVVPGFTFEASSVEDAYSVVLAPVVAAPIADTSSKSAGEAEDEGDALLEIAARALADLADLAALHKCDRPLHLLQGQVLSFGGVFFYVQDTVPAGAMVRVVDETQIAIGPAMSRNSICGWDWCASPPPPSAAAAGTRKQPDRLASPSPSSLPSVSVATAKAHAYAAGGTPPPSARRTNINDHIVAPPRRGGDIADTAAVSPETPTVHPPPQSSWKDAATSPTIVIRQPPKAVLRNGTSASAVDDDDDDVLSAPSASPSLGRDDLATTSAGRRRTATNEQPHESDALPSWSRRFADLNRLWHIKFASSQMSPTDVVNEVAELAFACVDLQIANNNAVAFLNRINAAGSRLLYTVPAPAAAGPQQLQQIDELVLVIHDDPDQVCLALELEGVRVAECWATPGGMLALTATTAPPPRRHLEEPDPDGNDDSDESSAAIPAMRRTTPVVALEESRLVNELQARQRAWSARCCYAAVTPGSRAALQPLLANGAVTVLGEPRRITRLTHGVLDDITRMLEYHHDNVLQRAQRLGAFSGSSLGAAVDWSFVMETWGAQLALLVRDVRTEMATTVAQAAQASNAAFLEVEAALEEFRAAHAQQAAKQAEEAVAAVRRTRDRHMLARKSTKGRDDDRLFDEDAAAFAALSTTTTVESYQKQHLAEMLQTLSNAVAHEMAGEADRAAQQGILDLWPQFEMLGTAYELVVSKLRSGGGFLDKLLVSRLEEGEVQTASVRSLYQGAVHACRQVTELGARDRIVKVREGDVEANMRERARARLAQLVHGASETDVFAGGPVIEGWLSDCRSFFEFLNASFR